GLVFFYKTQTSAARPPPWARIAEEAEFPADYEGTATPQAHRASEAIHEEIREPIVATNDKRLLSLLHLLGPVSYKNIRAHDTGQAIADGLFCLKKLGG
ncbi:hypothetical protein ACVGW7_19720, partial [Enterobacter intestinihominis]